MDDQPQGTGAASPPPSDAAAGAPQAGGDSGLKECVLCGEMIVSFADRCRACGGFLPIVEGRAFGQHFFFFVCSLALFLGALLPWEGQWSDSYGWRSISGAFLMVFAGYGMVAAFFNIFHRRMIVWPVALAAMDGTYAGWKRVAQISSSEAAQAIDFSGDLFAKKTALLKAFQLYGPGLWLVTIFATVFWLVFVMSVIQGGRSAAARKEAERVARAAKKK